MIFTGFSLLKMKYSMSLARYTFPIYCIHAYALEKFRYKEYVSNIYLNKWIIAGLAFCLSLLMAFVYSKLCRLIKREWSRTSKNINL